MLCRQRVAAVPSGILFSCLFLSISTQDTIVTHQITTFFTLDAEKQFVNVYSLPQASNHLLLSCSAGGNTQSSRTAFTRIAFLLNLAMND